MIRVFPILLLAASSASAETLDYDCQAEQQLLMISDKGNWTTNSSKVDRAQRETFRWTFTVTSDAEGDVSVTHDPGILDAIGVGGTYEATPIAPGQFAFATQKDANCLFTELACGAMVEISDIDAKKASFSLVPMGSVKKQDGSREILQLVMLGECKKASVSQ